MRLVKALYGLAAPPSKALSVLQSLRARRLWKVAIVLVLRLVRRRRLWASIGQELKATATLFSHLERKKGVLIHKKK